MPASRGNWRPSQRWRRAERCTRWGITNRRRALGPSVLDQSTPADTSGPNQPENEARQAAEKTDKRRKKPLKGLECHVMTAFSVKQHHPFKSAHIFRANPCISVIFCDNLMVPRWRRGTTVTAFKKGNEREESQTQSLPNQLQTSVRGEARAAAEAAENRDKIIRVSRFHSGGFASGSPGSGSSMEHHAKCTRVFLQLWCPPSVVSDLSALAAA